MKILYVSSEAAPFAASGGLGDVLGALPKEIVAQDSENTVKVILPLYGSMKEEYRVRMEKVADICFSLSWRKTGASVFRIIQDGVEYLFVENHRYFNRPKLYGEPDDGERFAFFSRAVVEYMLQCGDIPDVVHANDWQTALCVVYLKTEYAREKSLRRIRTVYTIHNIEYQGKFPNGILGDVFGIQEEHFHILEYAGCLNLMKGAITCSDYVTTVSPHYAQELQYDFFAFGLADIIRGVSGKMAGVINGIDYRYFSPDRGGDIVYPYSRENVKEGKARNKQALQAELSLPVNENIPLIVMITRLASGKGIDLVLRVLDELLSSNIQFVILGTGEPEYEAEFCRIAERHPNMRALIQFDRRLSKRMYAAADLFLMPSKSEPCGLAQMIACSYGTVPVVRGVGGLYDSIHPYGTENSNGFVFANYNAHEMLFLLQQAVALYKDEEQWDALVGRAIASDFAWKNSAMKYVEIYKKIINW